MRFSKEIQNSCSAALFQIGFPRIPLPSSAEVFDKVAELGERLCQTHLLIKEEIGDKITYPEPGDNIVKNIAYSDNKVHINSTQYFGGVSEAAWKFYVGAYQPLQKWLKDRKNQVLSFDEIIHYQRMVCSIEKTIELMYEIDKVVEF